MSPQAPTLSSQHNTPDRWRNDLRARVAPTDEPWARRWYPTKPGGTYPGRRA